MPRRYEELIDHEDLPVHPPTSSLPHSSSREDLAADHNERTRIPQLWGCLLTAGLQQAQVRVCCCES